MSYTHEVGQRLRQVRVQQGLSLQEVERVSEGRWKAAVVGSYERGDRNLSATRLLELADFYGVPTTALLPGDLPPVRERGGGLVLDLVRLRELDESWEGLRRFCAAIQHRRGDHDPRVLSIRGEDVQALAIIQDRDVESLRTALDAAGVLVGGG